MLLNLTMFSFLVVRPSFLLWQPSKIKPPMLVDIIFEKSKKRNMGLLISDKAQNADSVSNVNLQNPSLFDHFRRRSGNS
jgi:hypothetical protein